MENTRYALEKVAPANMPMWGVPIYINFRKRHKGETLSKPRVLVNLMIFCYKSTVFVVTFLLYRFPRKTVDSYRDYNVPKAFLQKRSPEHSGNLKLF